MKRLHVRSCSVLILLALTLFSTAIASSFDDIMSLPDYEESENYSDYLEFDYFLADFQSYCKSWQASFDTNKKQTKTLDDGSIVLQLDGVSFWVKVTDDRHEITQISVKLGDPNNAYKIDYNMMVKAYALIATLEYKKPTTSAERSSVLSSVMNDFEQNVEPAVSFAKTMGGFPVVFNNSSFSYAVTFSETEGYDFLVSTERNTQPAEKAESSSDIPKEEVTEASVIPVEITKLVVGNEASFTAKNNTEQVVNEIELRIRYYDENGEYILSDETVDSSPVNPRIATLSLPVDGGLIKQQSIVANASFIHPLVIAAKADIAVAGYTTADGTVYKAPESLLCWFSSDGHYLSPTEYHAFLNTSRYNDMIEKSRTISLGIFTEMVYTEFRDYYGFDQCGYLISKLSDDSVFKGKGIEVGDLLYSCNNSRWYDDPIAIERAKAELAKGKEASFKFLRGKEIISVVVSPSDFAGE